MEQVLRAVAVALVVSALVVVSVPGEVRLNTVARARTASTESHPVTMPDLVGTVGYAAAASRLRELGCAAPAARIDGSGTVVVDQHPPAGSALGGSDGACADDRGAPPLVVLGEPGTQPGP